MDNQTLPSTETLLKRAFLFLEDEEFSSAKDYCNRVLDIDPECAKAYVGLFMVEMKITDESKLDDVTIPLSESKHLKKAVRFATGEYKAVLESYINKNSSYSTELIYNEAVKYKDNGEYEAAIDKFKQIKNYHDSAALIKECENIIEERNKVELARQAAFEVSFNNAVEAWEKAKNIDEYITVLSMFRDIKNNPDTASYIDRCCQIIYNMALEFMESSVLNYNMIAERAFLTISDYSFSAELAKQCREKMNRIKLNTCPKCGKQNRAFLVRCLGCGSKLSSINKCHICGKQNRDSWEWCLGCGSKLGSTNISKMISKPHIKSPAKTNNTCIWLLSLMPLIWQVLLIIIFDPIDGSANYLWLIYFAINFTLLILDRKIGKKAGYNIDVSLGWILLFPVYLYKRAKSLNQSKAYFICFFISTALGVVAQQIYIRIYFTALL
jgi:hypothetical protein